MANPQHFDNLKRGPGFWQQWRREDPLTHPDLSGIDLSGGDFRGHDFSRVNLSGANLIGVDFSETDLRWANLREADLSGADLFKVDFFSADLSRAQLIGAALIRANFIEADLTGANLSEADFSWTDAIQINLQGAILSGTALIRANLIEANLSQAKLPGANLSRANLNKANLYKADLSHSELLGANLFGANLSEAKFTGANLTQVQVGYTNFGDVDLSAVRGLDKIKHYGPSTIGIDTVYRTQEQLPQVFLRGAGIPDPFIDYISSLSAQDSRYTSCFISYTSQDEVLALQLHESLQQHGIRCWFAPEDMKIGEKIRLPLKQLMRDQDKLVLILSQYSVESQWIEYEIKTVQSRAEQLGQQLLFPIQVDEAITSLETPWAQQLRETHRVIKFDQWQNQDSYQTAFQKLLHQINQT